MTEISRKIKLELFNAIIKTDHIIFNITDELWMSFLNEIWDLRAMPSEDTRYTNAYDDVVKHTISNDDWELEELFLKRLKLLDNDDTYIKFIENIVDPKYRKDEDDIVKYVLLINSYLENEKIILTVTSYNQDSLPIYNLVENDGSSPFSDLIKNTTPIYVIKKPNGYSGEITSHEKPSILPCYVLVFNDGWNDFGYSTEFSLYFHNESTSDHIGRVKITNGEAGVSKVIPDEFTLLDSSYCSLGQSYEYYETLKEKTGKYFESFLFALQDAAFYSDIYEKFEKNNVFNTSLIREDTAEQLLRSVKYKLYGFDLNNLYSFKYEFLPKYSKESVEVNFNFNDNTDLPNRIIGIIGKNGTGKTQLITSLPLDISKNKSEKFIPRTPIFSKVIAVSYSVFDNFEIPKRTAFFNYEYCGLLDEKRELLTERKQLFRFHKTCERIKTIGRIKKWKNILLSFIDINILNKFIIEETSSSGETLMSIDRTGFNEIKKHLSSGQNILVYIISEIISNIRKDSLLLFDEPETHLHPNAISQLMHIIYELVEEFESYCIITTHSPLIVQELLSKNVHIVEKHEDIVSVRTPNLESFGQNLTVLTEEIFGNNEIGKQYKKTIDKMILKGKDYDEIIGILETKNIPLSINIRLYIKSKFV
ncbi:MAG: AAA family ATPase [Candidatus Gracilibacteria bacterium]